MATVIQLDHARQGFADIAGIYGLSCAITEARSELTDYRDRHGHPLTAVVIEALADSYPGAEHLAAKLRLGRADTALTSQAGLVCWSGWLRQASQYDPVAVRLYAPAPSDDDGASRGSVS